MENIEKKKSGKKGCLIVGILAVVFLLLIFIIAIATDDGNDVSNNQKEEKEAVVDSFMIRHNDSLRLVEKKKIETEIKKFNAKYDDIEGTTWIYSKKKPYYSNSMGFYTYIGLNDNGYAWKRLVIRYHGDDWLFIKKIIVKTDNQTYTIDASNSERDNNADVWEWVDLSVGNVEDVIIQDIISSKQTKVRFVGSQYHHDWILSKKEVDGLKEIDDYYYLLNSYYTLNK